ncbi:MAG TPA: hypothetical protein ENJ53_00950, partial [Phaeodactylibacter sp.]|nr:hypothetical protein [Phaeodactylibacter sp.]
MHNKFQYSGYKYEVLSGKYTVLPCDSFDDGYGIGLRFVLGMDNFFPYEYRPLASLKKWKTKFTSAVNAVETKLDYLRYQEGNHIIENQDVIFSINNDTLDFVVAPWHTPPLDEGWEMSFYHKFESVCGNSIDSSTFVFEMDLNPQFPEPSDLIYDTTMVHQVGNPHYDTTFVSAIPKINMAINLANYTGFDNQASWDLLLINGSNDIAPLMENVWMQPISSTGLITNFQLINNLTGQVVPQVNGIFQIGTMTLGQLINFELTATNQSCQTEVIQLHYGWNCEPNISPNQTPCDDNIAILTATSPNGELEMDVTSPTGTFSLCEEIDYHTIEIYNAQLGNVFDVLLEATLPLGLELVAGSSQMAYPTGGTFVDIPDPVSIVGNVYQWDISALNSMIQTSGLLGVSQAPNHSVSIRFLTNTDCGFIAGSQIFFNTIGKQNCNLPTNTLSKAGASINIAGVNSSYTSDVNIAISNSATITCGSNIALSISILPDGVTSDSDSLLITLPPGVSYVAGSYVPINNAPTNAPIVFNNGGQQILKLKINAGIAANSLISFGIETTGY